jgi:uracil-DNA glycosylase
MHIDTEIIKCTCSDESCPVYKKCCFLPTECNASIDNKISLLFIGQGGGSDERRVGRPFVGRAGKRLRQQVVYARRLLKKHFGIAFSNSIRDNPDKNRVPTSKEYDHCLKYLYKDISILKDRGLCVLIPLGNASKSIFLPVSEPMCSSHGIISSFKNDTIGHIKIMPAYHPSYVIRNFPQFNGEKISDLDKIVIDDIIKAYEYAEEYYRTGVMENDLIEF